MSTPWLVYTQRPSDEYNVQNRTFENVGGKESKRKVETTRKDLVVFQHSSRSSQFYRVKWSGKTTGERARKKLERCTKKRRRRGAKQTKSTARNDEKEGKVDERERERGMQNKRKEEKREISPYDLITQRKDSSSEARGRAAESRALCAAATLYIYACTTAAAAASNEWNQLVLLPLEGPRALSTYKAPRAFKHATGFARVYIRSLSLPHCCYTPIYIRAACTPADGPRARAAQLVEVVLSPSRSLAPLLHFATFFLFLLHTSARSRSSLLSLSFSHSLFRLNPFSPPRAGSERVPRVV